MKNIETSIIDSPHEGEQGTTEESADFEYISSPLKSEHLSVWIKPIVACLGIPEEFKNHPGDEQVAFGNIEHNRRLHDVDYYGDPEEHNRHNFKNNGPDSYVISSVDTLDKFSKEFRDCTGLVVAGRDKKTGEDISFLSHEDPVFFLDNKRNETSFLKDLQERLLEIKSSSMPGTIDAVIVGGNYLISTFGTKYMDNYLASIKLLSAEITKVLGFEPVVITGPKLVGGSDKVFYDNKNRRLYIARPEVGDTSSQSYLPKDTDTQKTAWKKDFRNRF